MKIMVTANNCINRWKVLERSYKKFIDDQNKTGKLKNIIKVSLRQKAM